MAHESGKKFCMALFLLLILVVSFRGGAFVWCFFLSKTLACVFRSSVLVVYPQVAIQNLMCPFSY